MAILKFVYTNLAKRFMDNYIRIATNLNRVQFHTHQISYRTS